MHYVQKLQHLPTIYILYVEIKSTFEFSSFVFQFFTQNSYKETV